MPFEVLPQAEAADLFDHLASPVDVDAVFPGLPRVEEQRQAERLVLAFGDARNAQGRLHLLHVGVPDVVAEAGTVGQQVTQGDVALGRPRDRLPLGIKAGEHAHLAEFRTYLFSRCVELKQAALDALQRRHRGGGLGHGRDPAHGIGRHGLPRAQGPLAEASLEEDAFPIADGSGHTRYRASAHALTEDLADVL